MIGDPNLSIEQLVSCKLVFARTLALCAYVIHLTIKACSCLSTGLSAMEIYDFYGNNEKSEHEFCIS